MSISVADNFSYQGAKPLDARFQFSTVVNMKAATEATLYNGCFAYVTENKKYYTFDSSNTSDSTTGKWREFSSGSGEDTNAYHTDDTAETTLADNDYFPFYDTSATGKRRTLWSNIKSVLKTYFDTLYSTTKTRGTPTSAGTTLSLVNTGDMYNWNTDSIIYCTCSTAAATVAKVVTVSRGTFTLVAGAKVCVKFTYANTADSPTLNVASKGAKNIKYIGKDGTVADPTTWWGAGDVVTFIYDGTQFLMQPTYGMPSIPMIGTINRSDIYTTTEKVIGCWNNGKPLYQRLIQINPNQQTYATYTIALSDYVSDVNFQTVHSITGFYSETGYSNRKTNMVFEVNEGNLKISNTTSSKMWAGMVIIQYTKSTDAANSYNYANENDYSTSEKVVGTWLDSKPIYQRTFTGTLTNTTAQGTEVYTSFAMGANVSEYIRFIGKITNSAGNSHTIPTSRLVGTDLQCLRIVGWNNSSDSSTKNNVYIYNSWYATGTNTYAVTVQYTKV